MQRVPGDGGAAGNGFGWRGHRCILLVGAAFVAAGCEGPQSLLDPAGPSARAIAAVWWWMVGVAMVVWGGTAAAWLWGMRRGRTRSSDGAPAATDAAHPRAGRRWIVLGGLVLPSVSIAALLVFGTPAGRHQLALPWQAGDGPAPLVVHATGVQWRWELHYPATGTTLHNELRIPVGVPIDVHTQSRDVIHSFWVPRLGGKLDAIPGRSLVVRLRADAPGTYRGQCAEFCGLGHAHMVMTVVAMPPDAFDDWLRRQPPGDATPSRPAP